MDPTLKVGGMKVIFTIEALADFKKVQRVWRPTWKRWMSMGFAHLHCSYYILRHWKFGSTVRLFGWDGRCFLVGAAIGSKEEVVMRRVFWANVEGMK